MKGSPGCCAKVSKCLSSDIPAMLAITTSATGVPAHSTTMTVLLGLAHHCRSIITRHRRSTCTGRLNMDRRQSTTSSTRSSRSSAVKSYKQDTHSRRRSVGTTGSKTSVESQRSAPMDVPRRTGPHAEEIQRAVDLRRRREAAKELQWTVNEDNKAINQQYTQASANQILQSRRSEEHPSVPCVSVYTGLGDVFEGSEEEGDQESESGAPPNLDTRNPLRSPSATRELAYLERCHNLARVSVPPTPNGTSFQPFFSPTSTDRRGRNLKTDTFYTQGISTPPHVTRLREGSF